MSCISQLFDYVDYGVTESDTKKLPRDIADISSITLLNGSRSVSHFYVIGDSHTLTYAWQEVTVKGVQRLLFPLLVTGVKV